MKILRPLLALWLCIQFVCCTTVTGPDGTSVRKFDPEAFNAGVGAIVTIGGLFGKQPRPTAEVEYTSYK